MTQTALAATAESPNGHITEVLLPQMEQNAEMAAAYLKALSHPGRLMILCYLIEGEKTVTDLENLLGARQSSVSQHLARLRADRLVTTRRDGKAIHYSLADDRTSQMISLLHKLFCGLDQ